MLGHIRKRSKTSWAVVVDLGRHPGTGKRQRLWRSVKGTKRDAEALLAQLLVQKDTGVAPSRGTVQAFLDRWLEDYAKTNTAPKTYRTYSDLVSRHLKPALGAIRLSALRPEHIQTAYKAIGAKGLSPTTVLHCHRILRQALQHAVKWQVLARNPADAADPPRPNRYEIPMLDPGQIAHLLACARETEHGPLVELALMTGLRQGELLGLRWQDVDLEAGNLRVTRSLQRLDGLHFREPKTRGSRRSVALSPGTVLLLREHRADQRAARQLAGGAYEDHDLIFATAIGTPIDPRNLLRAWKKVTAAAGQSGLRFHDLRHAHASLMLAQGTHPKIVSERLGHSGVRITLDTYSHVLPNLQREAAAQLDQFALGGIAPQSAQRSFSSHAPGGPSAG
jgi:integrase